MDGTRKRQVERHGVVPSGPERAISGSCGGPNDTEQHRVDWECHTVTASESPRLTLANALTEALRAAVAAGDLGVATVAHEALGRLLGAAKGDVADLEEERAKRGRGGR